MTTLTIAEAVAAISLAHVLHLTMDVQNVRSKVKRLADVIAHVPVKPFPININTRTKAYSAGLLGLAILFGISFLVIRWLNPSIASLLVLSTVLLVVGELINLVGLDNYHVRIARITRQFETHK
ncbi:MAG TPA: hypothetical protein VNE40_00725 [Candidatus Dormibacteraeota bacterium]|nr:hypothetical protein [Candidatus Dormibacteraeota bacterium]